MGNPDQSITLNIYCVAMVSAKFVIFMSIVDLVRVFFLRCVTAKVVR